MSNSIATGVAYQDPEFTTAFASQQLGYTLSAQTAVTQATSKSTAVTSNTSMGQITLNGAALAANTAVSFVLNNVLLGSNDVVIINVNGGTAGAYLTYVTALTSGSATITVVNRTSGSLSEAIILNYAIIHGATS
jgi:hypothetical protein